MEERIKLWRRMQWLIKIENALNDHESAYHTQFGLISARAFCRPATETFCLTTAIANGVRIKRDNIDRQVTLNFVSVNLSTEQACLQMMEAAPSASAVQMTEEFISFCEPLELVPQEEIEISLQGGTNVLADQRARKIARFKRQRAAESKLPEIKERKERRGRSTRAAAQSTPVDAGEEDISDDDGEEEREVILRLSPLSSSEISQEGYNRCVRQESHQTFTWTAHPETRFTFDLVADETVPQIEVHSARDVMQQLLESYLSTRNEIDIFSNQPRG
ncbi:hypothetical protein V2J09_016845 [Rumex salicifolius]